MRNYLTFLVSSMIVLACVFVSVTDASSDEKFLVEKGLVPDVTGISLPEAQSILAAAGLTVGEIIYFYNDYYPLDQVFDQNPYPGQQVDEGTPVDLRVSAGLNPCPEFFDEWGVASTTTGGRALADTIEQLGGGDDMAEFYDYDAWDLNEDGVPERLALELISHIMCLPDTYVHPILGPVKPMQDSFYGTHTYVNAFLKKLWEKEDAIIALAQPMIDLGNHILAIGGELLETPITADYNLSQAWKDDTLGDLAKFMRDLGEKINRAVDDELIGPSGSLHQPLDNNISTEYMIAGMLAHDGNVIGFLLTSDYFGTLAKALSLADLNWDYLISLLQPKGVDEELVRTVASLIDATEFTRDDLPGPGNLYLIQDADENDLLEPSIEWGGDGISLEDLIDTWGPDSGVIWDAVSDLFGLAPVITLIGDAELTVECGSSYTDLGATAIDDVTDISGSIVIGGNAVDPSLPGDYEITYNVTDDLGNPAVEVSRTVTVVDTEAPVIALAGESIVTVECGDDYTDAGATASDACSGDITGNIIVEGVVDTSVPGIYVISYNVNDAVANAATTVVRTVSVADTMAPIISLSGEESLLLSGCESYVEQGFTSIIDGCEGTIDWQFHLETIAVSIWSEALQVYSYTTLVALDNDFNSMYSNESGDYLLQYHVSDSSDNEGVAERYISISCDQQEGEGEGEGETIEGESEGEGEGETTEGEQNEGENEGEANEGEGEPAEGEVEGEGEPAEGESPNEGEGESIDDILDDFDSLDSNSDGLLTCEELGSLSSEQCENLDDNTDGFISYEELVRAIGSDCQASIAAVDAEISCADFDQAQAAVTDAFASVHADDTCRNDLTNSIRIKQIVVSDGNGGAEIQDLDEIASRIDIFNASGYDYTVDSTRILFQHYLLFQPGTYEITYEISSEPGESAEVSATHVQRIIIGQDCGGCFGCNSRCESCRNSYIPAAEKGIKNFLDTFLLLGLAVLAMLAWPSIFQP